MDKIGIRDKIEYINSEKALKINKSYSINKERLKS